MPRKTILFVVPSAVPDTCFNEAAARCRGKRSTAASSTSPVPKLQ